MIIIHTATSRGCTAQARPVACSWDLPAAGTAAPARTHNQWAQAVVSAQAAGPSAPITAASVAGEQCSVSPRCSAGSWQAQVASIGQGANREGFGQHQVRARQALGPAVAVATALQVQPCRACALHCAGNRRACAHVSSCPTFICLTSQNTVAHCSTLDSSRALLFQPRLLQAPAGAVGPLAVLAACLLFFGLPSSSALGALPGIGAGPAWAQEEPGETFENVPSSLSSGEAAVLPCLRHASGT